MTFCIVLINNYARVVVNHCFFGLVNTGRNAVVVIVASLICLSVKQYYQASYPSTELPTHELPITPVDYHEGTLPFLHVPPLTLENLKVS